MSLNHLGLVLLINIVWGLTFLVGKWGVTQMPPIFFSGLRFLFLAVMLLPWLRLYRGQMKDIMVIGLTAGVLQFAFFYWGMQQAADITPVAIMAQVHVPISAVFAVLILKERMHLRTLIGTILAFGGVMILGFDPIVLEYIEAMVWIVFGSVAFSLSVIYMRKVQGLGVFGLQAWVAIISAPVLMIISFFIEDRQLPSLAAADWRGISSIFYTALASSIIGHGGMYYLLQRYPVTMISPFMLLAPVIGILSGVYLYDDVVTWRLLFGGLVTLFGVAVISVKRFPGFKKARLL